MLKHAFILPTLVLLVFLNYIVALENYNLSKESLDFPNDVLQNENFIKINEALENNGTASDENIGKINLAIKDDIIKKEANNTINNNQKSLSILPINDNVKSNINNLSTNKPSAITKQQQALVNNYKQKVIFANYKLDKRNIFLKQVLDIKLNALILIKDFEYSEVNFSNFNGIKLLSKKVNWQWTGDNNFSLSFQVSITQRNFKLPDINSNFYNEGKLINKEFLKGSTGIARLVQDNALFSGVIAKQLKVIDYSYEPEELFLFMELEAKSANLEDLQLKSAATQYLENLQTKNNLSRLTYRAILKQDQSILSFNYFNSLKENYEKINLDLSKFNDLSKLEDHLLSINPTKNNFPFLKSMLIISISLLLIFLFLLRKRISYLFVLIFFLTVVLVLLYEQEILVKKGTVVYLLPTSTSSMFYETNQLLKVKVKVKKNGYFKIILPDQKIGWIKASDVF